MSENDKTHEKKAEVNSTDIVPDSTRSFPGLRFGSSADFLPPFSRTIFLLQTDLAGCRYMENIENHLSEIKPGQKLKMLREPDNPYDKRAILVLNGDKKLGYVPRTQNAVLSRLMDAGKYLYAKAARWYSLQSSPESSYIMLRINIYMED